MMWNKWKKFIKRKGLNPIVNRKKFAMYLFLTTIGVFFIFISRFMYVVLAGKVGDTSLSDKTQQLYQGSSVIKAKRGTIYDRNGNIIAEDATSYSLYAVLDEEYLGISTDGTAESREKLYVQEADKKTVASVVAANTPLDEDYVLKQLNEDVKQVEFGNGGKNLTLETRNKINDQLEVDGIKGIYFKESQTRVYPNGVFSSHLIGYAQTASEEEQSEGLSGLIGRMGIEKSEEDILAGKDGEQVFLKDSEQRAIPGSVEVETEAENGSDIYTTLDLNLNVLLEQKMDEVLNKYQQKEATAMLVEAKTGNILAASQRPTFNPETKEGLEKVDEDSDSSVWQNLLVEKPYEPGSTMKVFTAAAGLELGVLNPNDYIKTGEYEFEDGTTIYDWNKKGVGTINYRQAFAFSSNVAMVALEQKMKSQWVDYIKAFGFNRSTGSGLLNESSGYLPDMTNSVDSAITSYGQGISVTPFQMVQAYTAIANKGEMLKPNFISKIVDNQGNETKATPKTEGNPISAQTATQTLDLMRSVVEDAEFGTGGNFKLEGYTISAKTGTAQVFNNSNGKYYGNEYLYSAVQIAPTEDPEYIMYVTINRPDPEKAVAGAQMVSEIANPVLKEALDRALK